MNPAILQRALDHFGGDGQLLKTVEECSELSTAIMHYRLGKVPLGAVIDELADVLIMTAQLRLAFDPIDVDEAVDYKMARLEKLLEAAS